MQKEGEIKKMCNLCDGKNHTLIFKEARILKVN